MTESHLDQEAVEAIDLTGHIPFVTPRHDGTWGVCCLQCSGTAHDFTYPCKVIPDRPDFWPPSDTLLDPLSVGVASMSGRISKGLQMARSRWMDLPSDSVEAKWLIELINALDHR